MDQQQFFSKSFQYPKRHITTAYGREEYLLMASLPFQTPNRRIGSVLETYVAINAHETMCGRQNTAVNRFGSLRRLAVTTVLDMKRNHAH